MVLDASCDNCPSVVADCSSGKFISADHVGLMSVTGKKSEITECLI
jgi:hypothetical protein